MTHHLPRLLLSTANVFYDFDNDNTLVGEANCPRVVTNDKNGSANAGPPLTSIELLRKLVRTKPQYIVFHSGFVRKFWIIILTLLVLRKKLIWICWGGELSNGKGLRSAINRILKQLCIKRMAHVICLSHSDGILLRARYGNPKSLEVIPYYGRFYANSSSTVSSYSVRGGTACVQVGNDASEINDHPLCLAALSSIGLATRIVLPFGYGRFDVGYINRVKSMGNRLFPNNVDFIDELLSNEQFDAVITQCDALLLGSRMQRALYSVYSYLSEGKPVFLPAESKLRADLAAQGFEINTIEQISEMSAADFIGLCRMRNSNNRQLVEKLLGLAAIREKWLRLVLT
jgi:hypothetical protein